MVPGIRSLGLRASLEKWPLVKPFQITGYRWEFHDALLVTLERGPLRGRGEAAGVYYRDETPESMLEQIETVRSVIEAGVSRETVQQLLPPGGARNALDSALWDLEAQISGRPAWQIAELQMPRPLLTTFTCGAEDPEKMADAALAYGAARAIKLKLTGTPEDFARVRAVRAVRPDVWLAVDANQGFTREFLDELMPVLIEARVALIEQPFPVGEEGFLDDLRSPIPVAADESAQDLKSLERLRGRFDVVNLKLDKCGGLTEALAMARAARAIGLRLMVGNMCGTSLAMAPAFLVGQLCDVVDLDGPVYLKQDRKESVIYCDGQVSCPERLWGYPRG